MPGPGGGSRGGGFGGGSFGGGGSRGGGFGGGGRGPRRHHYHHHYGYHYRPFWFFGPRYYYGGGFFGGLMSIMLLPVILILFASVFLFAIFGNLGSSITNVANGGQVVYDEYQFQDFADAKYNEIFGEYGGYEDNILISFITNEEMTGYYCIAWVGYNLDTNIYNMFGNEQTVFGKTIQNKIGDNYKHSFDKNLALAIDELGDKIEAFGLDSSFEEPSVGIIRAESKIYNSTLIPINEEVVNKALKDFTDETGIPIAVSVDDVEQVLDKKIDGGDVFVIIFCVAVIGVAIFLIVRNVKEHKRIKASGGNRRPNDSSDGNMFDDDNFNSGR